MERFIPVLTISIIFIVMSGCASSKIPAPTNEFAAANQAVEQAEQVGAEEYAPLEIRNAREKLAEAGVLIDRKENEKAKMLLEKAMADAELAEARALSAKAQRAVGELKETIEVLKQEIERSREN